MQKIYLNAKEVNTIQKVIRDFEIEHSFELIYENNSGIGSTLHMQFEHSIKDYFVNVTVPITTSEDW